MTTRRRTELEGFTAWMVLLDELQALIRSSPKSIRQRHQRTEYTRRTRTRTRSRR